MKLKQWLCCSLAALTLTVPLLTACKHIEKTDSLQPESAVSNVQSSAESSDDTYTGDQITPAMWKAQDEQGNYIYLFGSIHAADNAVYHLPDYFEKAYTDADALSFEVDMSNITDMASTIQTMSDLMYTDGTTIKDHLSADTYEKLVNLLKENNSYNSLYDYYKPLMWESLLENLVISKAGLDATKGVDLTLTTRAKNDGKEIMEVESMDFQTELFNNFSDELVEMLLSAYLEDNALELQTASLKELYEKWKSGQMTAEDTEDIDESTLTDEEKALMEEYNTGLLVNRNENMAKKVIDYMKSGQTVMLVVGAAHYLGDDGIIHLLEEQEITVTRITSADQLTVNDQALAA